MLYRVADEIYENPEEYKALIENVISRDSVQERILRVKHPSKGTRYISTSTTVLYDAQHHFQGVLSLGRDVTDTQVLEKRYRRIRKWLIPFVVLMVLASVGIFFGYPYVYREKAAMDSQRIELRDELAVDYRLLSSMLSDAFQLRERDKTHEILKRFLEVKGDMIMPYTGVILLDDAKKVFDAHSVNPVEDADAMIGSSYTGIAFQGNKESPHRVLTVYREHEGEPMGHRGIEVAFEMVKDGNHLGWLIFQLDTGLLENNYHADVETLKDFRFKDFVTHPRENDE
ncbi:MAG: hypothetical protein U5R49_00395 [Deltaproteobacteria bacterium]|nr:hypothetical protein [Deltaproteobacteria bacterium]